MKLIATKSFRNVARLNITHSERNNVPENHIPKGATFTIGTADKLEQFKRGDPDREKIQWLFFTGSAEIADDATVKRVQQEIKDEAARNATMNAAAEASRPMTMADLLKVLTDNGLIKAAKA
ncbi:MAG: hypothetical protein KGJ13_06470, partial [Patescibacteria group bacterium]|nr:hypothetical protein [Patescibacteria group bacterium]